MKKTAAILFFIFALVQAGSVVAVFFPESSYSFVMEEEKNEEKKESEKKEKKNLFTFSAISTHFDHEINTAFHLAEKIHTSPCLEKITPPPNFC